MRLTVNLEEDLYAVARSLAKAEDMSVSEAVNQLLRKAIAREQLPAGKSSRGFPVVHGNKPFGPDEVARLEDEP